MRKFKQLMTRVCLCLVAVCWCFLGVRLLTWVGDKTYCEKDRTSNNLFFISRNEAKEFYNHSMNAELYSLDLVGENQKVDQVSCQLKNNIDVITEAQRIHFNIFKTLFRDFKYAMLFGLASFENKGDPAITVGQLLLLRRLKIKLVFYCFIGNCSTKTIRHAQDLAKNYSSKDLVILLQGGGNILSYVTEDNLREKVLQNFKDFEAVLFPQSIWIRSSLETHKRKFQTVYSSHPHLTILYRDRDSLEKGKVLFPKARALLVPDMAFQLGAVTRIMEPTHEILWLRRSDDESLKYSIPKNVGDYDVCIADWLQWPTPKGSTEIEKAHLITANGLLFLQRGNVVITDRLHGHILSTLLEIPHVILDNVNHKITSYMASWTGSLETVIIANSSDDALQKALELSKRIQFSNKRIQE